MKKKPKSLPSLIVGIVVVLLGISVMYFVLANLLFSRTYDMLTQTLQARGESYAERLASEVSFGLVANTKEDVQAILADFQDKHHDVETIAVVDADLGLFANVGQVDVETVVRDLEISSRTTSHVKQDMLVSVAPSRTEVTEKPAGYVIYCESMKDFLDYRRQMMIVVIVCSVLGLTITGKLLHAQVTVSLQNNELLVDLETRAKDLRNANIELQKEIEERKSAQQKLSDYQDHLEDIIEERTAELKKTQSRLVDASRRAGMAEIATDVLHNVGNVLNSINVAANLVQETVRESRLTGFNDAVELLEQYRDDLGTFLTEHESGKLLPHYLRQLAEVLVNEQSAVADRIDDLIRKVEQVKVIVSLQQSYAQHGGLSEKFDLAEVVEDAIQINEAGLSRHGVKLIRELGEVPPLITDKRKLVQILVNLISNAKYAMDGADEKERAITVQTRRVSNGFVEISVNDEGVGILPENLTRIFNHGFTTRSDGHGFGLHSAANAAHELGGKLTAHSEGEGKGARFVLEIPIEHGATRDG